MRTILLGTSDAWPIPRPGCSCPQCAEARGDARLRRTRSGLWLEAGDEVVLVDAGTDLVHQLEREGLAPRVARVVVTHTHSDHILGLGDLAYLRPADLPLLQVHAAPYHQERIARIFPGLVRWGAERIRLQPWQAGARLELDGAVLEGFETGHDATFPTTGVVLHVEHEARVRRIAYATDMGEVPAEGRDAILGADLLVGDGTYLGAGGHGHPGTDAVARLAREMDVGRLAFTHVGHVRLDDAALRNALGSDVGLAHDGDDLLALLG